MNLARPIARSLITATVLSILAGLAAAQDVVLEYQGRYNCQLSEIDHLMNVCPLPGGRILITGTPGLTLLNLDALPFEGTYDFIRRQTMYNARETVAHADTVLYINMNRWGGGGTPGFMIFTDRGDSLVFHAMIEEPDVFYEKMCVQDDRLYVTAHDDGLRIFDLVDPLQPTLIGSLDQGFADAWDVDVAGDIAYVADGAGGLKRVDVSDPARPRVLDGEDPQTAVGTAMEVTVRDGHAYTASGAAGIAWYRDGDPLQRILIPVMHQAEHLAWLDDGRLCASDMHCVYVHDVAPDGSLALATYERLSRRGQNARLRLCVGLDTAPGGLVLCAAWNYLDVFRLVPAAQATAPDLTLDRDRLRLSSQQTTGTVTITNTGVLPATITGADVSHADFTCSDPAGVLAPGETTTCEVTYTDQWLNANGELWIWSDDPDENPLVAQVFGRTDQLDPGEPVPGFTLPAWSQDPQGNWFSEDFDLAFHLGEIVWIQVYGTW